MSDGEREASRWFLSGKAAEDYLLGPDETLCDIEKRWPIGTELTNENDGFAGTVQGYYITREGKPGLVLQMSGTRVIHVYRERWFQ